jgi:hypothetical protein
VSGALPDDWPVGGVPKSQQPKGDEGLKVGVVVAIALSVLIVVGLLVQMIIRKRQVGESMRKNQTSPRDPSQSQGIEADGGVFQQAVKSFKDTPPSDGYDDFEAPDAMSVEVERPKTPVYEIENNGAGHGRII